MAVILTSLAGVIALPLPAFAQGSAAIEAETGNITSPFILTNGYVFQPWGTNLAHGGGAKYDITISQAGRYAILAFVSSPDHASSLAVNIDAEPTAPTMIWDIPASQEFANRIVSWRGDGTSTNAAPCRKVFNLSLGPHQIIIRGGADGGARLDRFSIVRIPAPPGGLRVVATP